MIADKSSTDILRDFLQLLLYLNLSYPLVADQLTMVSLDNETCGSKVPHILEYRRYVEAKCLDFFERSDHRGWKTFRPITSIAIEVPRDSLVLCHALQVLISFPHFSLPPRLKCSNCRTIWLLHPGSCWDGQTSRPFCCPPSSSSNQHWDVPISWLTSRPLPQLFESRGSIPITFYVDFYIAFNDLLCPVVLLVILSMIFFPPAGFLHR